jgi:hypothetical protein
MLCFQVNHHWNFVINFNNQKTSQLPLNPVCPVTKIFFLSSILLLSACSKIPNVNNETGSCNIDKINDKGEGLVTVAPGPIILKGWVVDKSNNSVPGKALLQIESSDGSIAESSKADVDIPRADVASVLGNENYLVSGFKAEIDGTKLMGPYGFSIVISAKNGYTLCRIPNKRLEVK